MEFIFLLWFFTDGLESYRLSCDSASSPFMQTSAKFSDFLQPSYTPDQWKLTPVGLISHWFPTSMRQLLLAVVEILFSRHKQFLKIWRTNATFDVGALRFYPRLNNHKYWMQITCVCVCVCVCLGVLVIHMCVFVCVCLCVVTLNSFDIVRGCPMLWI